MSPLDNNDLRVISLLHALGDRDELIREAVRLLQVPDLDEDSWRQVCTMGRDVAPEHPLFDPERQLHRSRSGSANRHRAGGRRGALDRREGERRLVHRRGGPDRRTDERRAIALPWLGRDRREIERRRAGRRHSDEIDDRRG